MDELEFLEIKERAWERLNKLPGVHAVGIGSKVVAGTRTGELAIAVFVRRKKSLEQLEANELVPLTIEGVKTDVIEMGMPRLSSALPPFTPNVEPLKPPDSGAVITLRAIDPVPQGKMYVVNVTTIPKKDPTKANNLYSSVATTGKLTAAEIAEKLAVPFQFRAEMKANHPAGTDEIHLKAEPTFTLAVNCYVLTLDTKKYDDYLRGGIRIDCGEPGTLGCLGTTASGKVVAITNQHIVCERYFLETGLRASTNPTLTTITFKRVAASIAANSLVWVEFSSSVTREAFAFYTTSKGEDLPSIAKGVADAINNASIPGLHASQDKVNEEVINVTGAIGADTILECHTNGPNQNDPVVHLQANVMSKPSAALTKVIKFSGRVSKKDNYGIFIRVNSGGTPPTFGVFVDPAGLDLNAIAQKVSDAINGVAPFATRIVFAKPTGTEVEVKNVEEVECVIQSDIRVGHPTRNLFWACSDQFGRVIDARLDVDAAIIQLDPGIRYKPQIEGIGIVDGILPKALLKHGEGVQKRGHISGVTTGEISHFAITGALEAQSNSQFFGFVRWYSNAMRIESTTRDLGTATLRPFMLQGDSGSALVTSGTGSVKVVGLLFGGNEETTALATPIEQVIDAFPDLKLSFALAPGQDPNAVQTVRTPAIAFKAIDTEEAAELGRMGAASDGFGWSSLGGRLREAEREIRATGVGREYASVIQTHFAEVQTLVNSNRRVGTVWQRSGGPEIMNRMLEMIYARDQRLPTEINGKPFADCLARIQLILMRYASPAFSKDLSRYAPQIAKWSGMTYTELLAAFQNSDME